jgi:hypothetical protein
MAPPSATEPTAVEPYSIYASKVLRAGHCVQKNGAGECHQNGSSAAKPADRVMSIFGEQRGYSAIITGETARRRHAETDDASRRGGAAQFVKPRGGKLSNGCGVDA